MALVPPRAGVMRSARIRLFLAPAIVALCAAACSSPQIAATTSTTTTTSHAAPASSSTTARTTPPPPVGRSTTPHPPPPHIMVIMMENKGLSQVIGQSDQPYTNSLARAYGLATQSYAFGHPSLPNYLDLVSGSSQGVTDDNPPSSHRFPASPTLADQLAAAGFSSRAYAEDLPPDPTTSAGNYAVRHVPWEYFPAARISVSDASSLLTDLNATGAPDFVWYTPNLIDDEHNGTVDQGDSFLSRLIPAVQSTLWYRSGGQIIVEWDESDADNAGINGGDGGHIPTIVVSDALKARPRQDPTPVDTAGVLRSIEDAYGLAHLGGAAAASNGTIDSLLAPVYS